PKKSELYIWVIKPTGEVTFRKADLKPLWQKENTTLDELVSTTRKSLGVSDDERDIFSAKFKNPVNEKIQRESLQKLHQLLVKPIADLLPTDPNQRVTFVPQGNLFLVPFPALMDSKGKYLIEKHTILTAPAIQVLELTRSQKQRIKSLPGKSRQNALIVGNPTMPKFNTKYGEPGKQLSSLPGAKREAEAIAPLFNTTALTGDEATETTIKTKLPQAGVIHLATHGLFDGFQGLQSSIALAPSSQDNGLLTASEILDIKLNADLVVLSACNTGRGRITGDGVIGLSRSLFLAGTPSVLVSLWSVPDAPTAELMTDFYQNLYQKNLDKAQALRQAMLKMKEQYPKSPRKWAAFTLIGEAE
ncbi:MAG: CHAT domain-containing protein, partial [Rivularia sp. (in: cyanobacteria)]